MKKILAQLLALTMVFALAACSSNETKEPAADDGSVAETPDNAESGEDADAGADADGAAEFTTVEEGKLRCCPDRCADRPERYRHGLYYRD